MHLEALETVQGHFAPLLKHFEVILSTLPRSRGTLKHFRNTLKQVWARHFNHLKHALNQFEPSIPFQKIWMVYVNCQEWRYRSYSTKTFVEFLLCLKWKLQLNHKRLFMYESWIVTFKIRREILNGVNLETTFKSKNSTMFPHTDGFVIPTEDPLGRQENCAYSTPCVHHAFISTFPALQNWLTVYPSHGSHLGDSWKWSLYRGVVMHTGK